MGSGRDGSVIGGLLILTRKRWLGVAAYLDPVREMVQPVDVGLFAGVMDYAKLPFILRLMKAMKSPKGDFRDWEAIRAWADQAHARLM